MEKTECVPDYENRNGIKIDPHTLAWAEYWLTRMLNKENEKGEKK